MTTERQTFYKPKKIKEEVEEAVKNLKQKNEKIDYLTFVPDGEPTLDKNLGKTIKLLKPLNIDIAIITNSSLITNKEVQKDLMKADWVSLKIDAKTKKTWRKINRPHKNLNHKEIQKEIKTFAKKYQGKLNTETMLVKNANDNKKDLNKTAEYIKKIKPDKAYISIPTRPPAEKTVEKPTEQKINQAYQIYTSKNINAEYLIGYEGNQFSSTGNFKKDILNITSVHPMRKQAVKKLIKKDNANWNQLKQLINQNKIQKTQHENKTYYIRTIKKT